MASPAPRHHRDPGGLAVRSLALFPSAAGFLPGRPDDKTISRSLALASVLLLLAGLRSSHGAARWFMPAGVAGSFGLRISVAETVPVILGIAAGMPAPAHWLGRALGGAVSSLLFYLVGYYPAHLGSWRLQVIHPLNSLTWLGLGTALFQAAAWRSTTIDSQCRGLIVAGGPAVARSWARVSRAVTCTG